jgi:hypothetical protein
VIDSAVLDIPGAFRFTEVCTVIIDAPLNERNMMKSAGILPFVFATSFLFSVSLMSCSQNQKTWYLWTSFVETADGRDGLHLAVSPDGMNWRMVKSDSSVFRQEKWIMRDPCIARDESGVYHLVWTTAWNTSETKSIGYARSNDLIHWEKEKIIPVMENEPETENAWAPEIFWDKREKNWIITWSSTVRGKYQETAHIYRDKANGRVYFMRTRDFETFTPSALLFDAGCLAIDQTYYQPNDSTYYIFFKADRDTGVTKTAKPERGILRVKGSSPTGPFALVPGRVNNWSEKDEDGRIEGPTIMKIGKEHILYYGASDYSGAYKSSDLKSWVRITDDMMAPKRYMHGTVIEISEDEAKKLLAL